MLIGSSSPSGFEVGYCRLRFAIHHRAVRREIVNQSQTDEQISGKIVVYHLPMIRVRIEMVSITIDITSVTLIETHLLI